MVFIESTEVQKQLKHEARRFVEESLTSEIAAWFDPIGIHPIFRLEAAKPYIAKLGQNGWLVPWLSKELGGINASHVDTLVLNDAILEQGAIAPALLMLIGPAIVAPSLARVGTEEQKKKYLPKIAQGEIEFCIGYTEPEAGTDLASLSMQAVEDGNYYIINGQKCFNTHAHVADYHWLLARTDFSAPKHKGISLFIVDLKTPGITIRPVWCMGDERTNDVFYDNVRVPKANLVGEKNRGFYYAMTAAEFERYVPTGGLKWLLNKIIEFVQESNLAQDRIVQHKIAHIATEVEVASLISYRVAYLLDEGKIPLYQSSMAKIFTCECFHRMLGTGLQIMGPLGLVTADSKWAALIHKLQRLYQLSLVGMIGGGTNDMLRSSMVTRGFGLPPAW